MLKAVTNGDSPTMNTREHAAAHIAQYPSVAEIQTPSPSPKRKPYPPNILNDRQPRYLPCNISSYKELLERSGKIFLFSHVCGISSSSKKASGRLRLAKHPYPQNTIFSSPSYEITSADLLGKSEALLNRRISPLLVPSVEDHALLYQDPSLNMLVENADNGWNHCVPLFSPRPQPDFAVGFRLGAFTPQQIHKLNIGLDKLSERSYFRATKDMVLPFFTCEAKRGSMSIDISDLQNAHNMAIAVRGIVMIFQLAGLEARIHREVVAWSVSHDHRVVRVYGYYPVFDGFGSYRIHSHLVFSLDLLTCKTEQERFKVLRACVQVYHEGVCLLARIRAAIDQIPERRDPPEETMGLVTVKKESVPNEDANEVLTRSLRVNADHLLHQAQVLDTRKQSRYQDRSLREEQCKLEESSLDVRRVASRLSPLGGKKRRRTE